MNSNEGGFGFSHAAFQSNIPGYADRHPNRDHIPPINTDRLNTNMMSSELQTPATGLDMNFTPLLPSNLLIGSPLQPTSPMDFATPQFQSFGNIASQHPNQQSQQQQNHQQQSLNQLSQQQQDMLQSQQHEFQPQDQQHMMSAPQIFQQMMTPDLGGSPFLNATQSPPMAYGPFAAAAAAAAAAQPLAMMQQLPMQQQQQQGLMASQSRTVYLGNIPPDTNAEEVLSHVRSGPIESVRLLADKNCAFISFLDGSSATHFHSDAILKKLCIKGQDIKIGWGKPSSVPTTVALAVQQSGASRNVYLGNLPEETTEADLREELGKFGPIDTVKIVKEKAIGFVHFLSIANAVKAVTQLPQTPKWQSPRRVYYGKDRCAYVSKTQQQNAAQYLGIAPGYAHVLNGADRDLISNALTQQSMAAAAVATTAGGTLNIGNRTVYLGNIHPETTIEEICNVVRGGLLHHIRYIPDKHICFVTFIDPTSAASFFALSNLQGLIIHNRRLKIGWGKHSGALPPAISMAVAGGASRNVYIGNLDESWTEDRLRQDFSEYGEIELVNTLREKSCAFVNFTNIANAITAIEGVRGKEDYKRFKVNFGKDRCGNPPRHYVANNQHQQAQGQQSQPQTQQPEGFPSPDPSSGLPSVQPRTASPAPNASSNSNNGSQSQPATVLKPGETANPLTMYLAAAQQNQFQQPDNMSVSTMTPGQEPISLEQAFYSNDNTKLPTLGGGLEPPSQFGHQSARSVNLGAGISGLHNGLLPLHKRHLSVGAMNQVHNRTNSLPAFTQPNLQQQQLAQSMLNAQNANAFGGLGASLANLSLGQQQAPTNGQMNGHNPFGVAIQADNALQGWVEE